MRLLESVGFGGGFVDFDHDGYQDILLVGSPHCALYRNRHDGSYEDVTMRAGLGATGDWIGCAVGDYDNDGYPDLLITGYGRCALYHNERNGSFRDVTQAAGVGMIGKWSTAATFADFDRDGKLDLYIGAYCKFGPQSRQYCVLHENGVRTGCRPIDYDAEIGHCFRNQGDGRFQDVTQTWGLDKAHGKNLGASVADFNNDGWPDLYLANDEMPADLFENEHGKTFRNVALETGTAYGDGGQLMGGMGADWGDYDNDGWLDLAVGTFEGEEKALFHSQQGRSFELATARAGIGPTTYTDVVFGTLLFDYDNDGWLDLLFVNGHTMDNIEKIRPTKRYREPARLFRNRHAGSFEPVTSASLSVPIAGRGVACGDPLNDGRVQLLVIDMDGKVRLLRSRAGQGNHWIEIEAQGTQQNRDAIGARVRLTVGSEHRVAEVRRNRSYLSACDPRVHFGLGSATHADEIEVRWPDGQMSRKRGIAADQIVRFEEGK
jgi:hypothetical protein